MEVSGSEPLSVLEFLNLTSANSNFKAKEVINSIQVFIQEASFQTMAKELPLEALMPNQR